jgi:hypothetical protein
MLHLARSGYCFAEGVSQYSAGVAAEAGFGMTRVQFTDPIPLRTGLERAERIIQEAGRPVNALCAVELRSPSAFTEEAFMEFNADYTSILQDWGLIGSNGLNPIARSHVCPSLFPVSEPSVHAFSFTEVRAGASGDFVISGSAEAPEGHPAYRDHIESFRDLSTSGLQQKARFVTAELRRRISTLGLAEVSPNVIQIYSVHNVQSILITEVLRPLRVRHAATWVVATPPVLDLEYEMDCRTVGVEQLISSEYRG